MRLRNPFNRTARRARRCLDVIEALERDGCRVLDASAHCNPPAVRVDRQPSNVDTYGYLPPPGGCVRVPVLCVARLWDTRIEWISKEPCQ